jgi:hypothetical protein
MRLEELFPEKWIYSLGSFALLLASALFAYELLRPRVTAHAGRPMGDPRVYLAPKQSPFLAPSEHPGQVLVKLPELPERYQKKVFYLWQGSRRSWLRR